MRSAVQLLLSILILAVAGRAADAQKRVAPVMANDSYPNLKPKDVFKECDKCPELVVVPAGRFTMGSLANEEGRNSDEGPQHQVTFSQSFAFGRFAVTFDEWDACVADGGCNGYKPSDQGWGRGRRPVINVSWDDAKAYVAWLSRRAGKTYRLLSEAEREYVTRAGTTTPFWWGSMIDPNQANYDGNSVYKKGSKAGIGNGACPWTRSNPTPGVFSRCMAMCGNGRRIAGIRITTVREVTARLGYPQNVVSVCVAAAPGSTIRGSFAQPTAAGTTLLPGTTSTVSELPGRSLPLESCIPIQR